jgi:membrane-bound metal-dependent hydrolase YbcI (DUF457 family)
MTRAVIALAAGWVLALHPVLDALEAPVFVVGPLDWSSHLATAILIVANLPARLPPAALRSALVASLAIDLDHVPYYLGSSILTAGAPRPYTHSLGTVAVLLLAAAALRGCARQVAAGAALGVTAHLVRDLATGGVPLLWPFARSGVAVPFWIEAALLGVLATRAWLRAPVGPLTRRRA